MPKRRTRKKRYDRFVVIGIIVALIIIAVVLWGPLRTDDKTAGRKQGPKVSAPARADKKDGRPAPSRLAPGEPGQAARSVSIAILIDDLGRDMGQAKTILALPAPVALAVLPRLPHSGAIARKAKQAGREVLLHLPMEAQNSGKKRQAAGILRSDMTPMEFMATISDDIESVPGAIGVNNHEGSALTENREAMNFLMSSLRDRGLFFIDSLTSPQSVGIASAREFGVKTAKRDVFIDAEAGSSSSVRSQLEELVRLARKNGSAIGIGHPHPETLRELKQWLANREHGDIKIVPVSQLVK